MSSASQSGHGNALFLHSLVSTILINNRRTEPLTKSISSPQGQPLLGRVQEIWQPGRRLAKSYEAKGRSRNREVFIWWTNDSLLSNKKGASGVSSKAVATVRSQLFNLWEVGFFFAEGQIRNAQLWCASSIKNHCEALVFWEISQSKKRKTLSYHDLKVIKILTI